MSMMKLRRVGAVSVAITMGAVYFFVGIVVAVVMGGVMMLGFGALAAKDSGNPLASMFAGGFFLILAPIFYGILGFLGGLIGAGIYNLVSRFTGGIEMEFTGAPSPEVFS
jgi:hypothetical protein